jgi:hypothetical protein
MNSDIHALAKQLRVPTVKFGQEACRDDTWKFVLRRRALLDYDDAEYIGSLNSHRGTLSAEQTKRLAAIADRLDRRRI